MILSFKRDLEIFLISVLILFLELVLIRWIGTEVRVFAYLGNLVLVVCFFGIGLGCYLANQPINHNRIAINLLILITLITNPLKLDWLDFRQITLYLNGFEDSLMFTMTTGWTKMHLALGLLMMGSLLFLLISAFIPAGQILGRGLANHPQIVRAYSINIVGSLIGVWLLNIVSWASLSPTTWFAIVSILVVMLTFLTDGKRWTTAILMMVATIFVWIDNQNGLQTVWSPYHKLVVSEYSVGDDENRVMQGRTIEVNGTFFQRMVDRSDMFFSNHSNKLDLKETRRRYVTPFWFKPEANRMLIIGAGSGNNAADALRMGVKHIDCVEIDPEIYRLGKQLHPEQPYSSPKVHMTITDARAFLKTTNNRYDVIWFAWLDSHTLGSSYNNLRLDHYVYTRESLQEAKNLLTEEGIIFMNFAAEREWIKNRLFTMFKEVFGHNPLTYQPREGSDVALVASKKPLNPATVSDPEVRKFIQANEIQPPITPSITTDDWPYLYLEGHKIPKLHLFTSLTILGTIMLSRKRIFGIQGSINWHYFALGAAFLLLEVQTVSRATLLFGMTWVVNAIVISAVLIMILLANLVTHRWPMLPQWIAVAGLTVSVGSLALIPLDSLNGLEGITKSIVATAFLTAPVFFGGLIFIRSFANCEDKARALGSNLIGALVGGLLESLSFVTGIRALVLLVGLFYLIALWRQPIVMQRLRTST